MIEIIRMSREEAESLEVVGSFGNGAAGEMLVASTARGICFASFVDSREKSVEELIRCFPHTRIACEDTPIYNRLFFDAVENPTLDAVLHLRGTEFQIAVWRELLRIPSGMTVSYSDVANGMGRPKSCRAVGNAVGNNPVAILVPCHRIVRADGSIGGYSGGLERKKLLMAKENIFCFA